ncbi:MAG: hypothetical protein WCB31_04470 [Nitrososphaeraceae archaeon]|jgi:hypothetical protein
MSNQYLNKFMVLPDNGYYFLESEIMIRWMDGYIYQVHSEFGDIEK